MATTNFYCGSGDGYTRNVNISGWSTAHDATSSSNAYPTVTVAYPQAANEGGGNFTIGRLNFPTDTSSIGSGQVVTDAVLHFVVQDGGTGINVVLVPTTQASTSTLATTDFDEYSFSTMWSSSTAISGTGAKSVTLNATGEAGIEMEGITKLGLLEYTHDYLDSEPTGQNYMGYYMSEQTGTSNDPYIAVTYEADSAELVVDTMALSLTFNDVTLTRNAPLTVDTMPLALTFNDIILIGPSAKLVVDTMALSLTYNDVTLTGEHKLPTDTMALALTFNDVLLTSSAMWANNPKNTTTFTSNTKNTTTWTNNSKT